MLGHRIYALALGHEDLNDHGGHCQVNLNPLFFDAKSMRANKTNQRLRWHVDQWNLQEIG